ncbi:MAG: GldG family protein [Opitutaceae bacterium]|nr:GldG family protein [Verrucomicrobiales bacterium]
MADQPKPRNSFSAGQRWINLLNAFLGIAAVIALVVMTNYLSAHHFKRLSWSASSRIELTRQTVRILQSVTNRINVIIYFDAKENVDVYDWVSGLLKEYRNVNRRIEIRTVDYTTHPGDAAEILSRYKFSGLKKDFVLFECDGRTRAVQASSLVDLDMNDVITGVSKEVRKKSFSGEWWFTSAIFTVAYPSQSKAYFLTGHGEANPDNSVQDMDYGKFAELLKAEANVGWEKLSLQGTNDVPADCSLLIVARPSKATLDPGEIERIDAYLRRNGRMFVLMNNAVLGADSGIEKVLNKWGIGVGNNMIVDPRNSPARDESDIMVTTFNAGHPVMKSLASENLPLHMLHPRAVGGLIRQARPADAPAVQALASSSTNSQQKIRLADGKFELDQRMISFPVIAAVEQGSIKNVSTGTRIVVAGDQYFLNNQMIDSAANRYFAGFAVNWLLDRPQVLLDGIGPRPIKSYKLLVTAGQSRRLQWILLAGLPGGVMLLGTLVWLRRRS